MPKAKYVEDEASCDDKSDAHSESGESEEGAELSDVSDDEVKPQTKRRKQDEKATKKGVVVSNKKIDPSLMPKKPTVIEMPKNSLHSKKPFYFRMTFTNGILLQKFIEPIAHSVKMIRFALNKSPSFTGFRMEAHNAMWTLANKSRFECDVESGLGVHGSPMTDEELNKYVFCVNAKSFMEALTSSALKETTLSISRQHHSSERITFESVNNENDVSTVQTCDTVQNSEVESLEHMKISLGFHVNVHMGTLKQLSLNAKRCGALSLKFELQQAVDLKDSDIIHSKMCIGFEGESIHGNHDFYLSTKKSTKEVDGKTVTVWDPLPGLSMHNQDGLVLEKKCSSEYDNSKLRLFLNHMECNWVLVHLGNDNSNQNPLVLDCVLGGTNTKHTIIVGPKVSTT